MSEITERRQVTITAELRIIRCDGCGRRAEPVVDTYEIVRDAQPTGTVLATTKRWRDNTDGWRSVTATRWEDNRHFCPACVPQLMAALGAISWARFGAEGPDDELDDAAIGRPGPKEP